MVSATESKRMPYKHEIPVPGTSRKFLIHVPQNTQLANVRGKKLDQDDTRYSSCRCESRCGMRSTQTNFQSQDKGDPYEAMFAGFLFSE